MTCEKSLIICTNYRCNPKHPSCAARGSLEILAAFQHAITEQQLPCQIETFKCLSRCQDGPVLRLMPGGRFFTQVTPADVPAILQAMQGDNASRD